MFKLCRRSRDFVNAAAAWNVSLVQWLFCPLVVKKQHSSGIVKRCWMFLGIKKKHMLRFFFNKYF